MDTSYGGESCSPYAGWILLALVGPFLLVLAICYGAAAFAKSRGSTLGMDTPWSFIVAEIWKMLTTPVGRALWYVLSGISFFVLMLRVVPRSVYQYAASLVAWFAGITFIQYLTLRRNGSAKQK